MYILILIKCINKNITLLLSFKRRSFSHSFTLFYWIISVFLCLYFALCYARIKTVACRPRGRHTRQTKLRLSTATSPVYPKCQKLSDCIKSMEVSPHSLAWNMQIATRFGNEATSFENVVVSPPSPSHIAALYYIRT